MEYERMTAGDTTGASKPPFNQQQQAPAGLTPDNPLLFLKPTGNYTFLLSSISLSAVTVVVSAFAGTSVRL